MRPRSAGAELPLVAGVDSSTQSTKVELRDTESGQVVASAHAPHPPTSPPCSEQDPGAWWDALTSAMDQLGDRRADVVAISVAAQQHGLVVLDDADELIRPAKLWNDVESAPEAAQLVAELGVDAWASACGSVPVASFTITKLAWLAAKEPASFARVRRILLPHDWLTWRLSGEHVTDRGDASGTGWWSPATEEYLLDLLALIDSPRDLAATLPAVLDPTESAGTITSGAAEDLGLPGGVVVGPGTGDNMAAALGLGLSTSDVVVSLGTSGTAYARSDSPTADVSGAVAGLADATGGFLPLVCTLNATRVTDTVAAWLGFGRDDFADAAQAATPGAGGTTLIPYFDGERTPNLPTATGLFSGLHTSTTRADLARAAHEGVACGLLDAVDALAAVGVNVGGRLLLVGGGARSAAYQQVFAQLAARAITLPTEHEVVAAGAAVQAAVAASDRTFEQVTHDWGLGSAEVVEPPSGTAGDEVRSRYAEVARSHVGRDR